MAGYFDPQYGWVNTGGKEETMPLPSGLRRAADAVFSPGDPQAEASAAAGADPRFRFDPAQRVAVQPAPSPVADIVRAAAVGGPSSVIHEAGYNLGSFPEGDVRHGFGVDTSRGTAGMDWAQSHTPGDREVVRAPSTGPHTQGELEGMANAKRMIDAAYGPDQPDFDPNAARVADLEGQAKLKLAQTRAADPVAFAASQAQIPAQAQTNARLAGGLQLAHVFDGFEQQTQALEQKRSAMHESPQYKAATPQARAEADARLDAEKERSNASLRVLQQAMGFATGQTPASLYAERPGG